MQAILLQKLARCICYYKNLALASQTKVLEFGNGKSFRRVTEEGYLQKRHQIGDELTEKSFSGVR